MKELKKEKKILLILTVVLVIVSLIEKLGTKIRNVFVTCCFFEKKIIIT